MSPEFRNSPIVRRGPVCDFPLNDRGEKCRLPAYQGSRCVFHKPLGSMTKEFWPHFASYLWVLMRASPAQSGGGSPRTGAPRLMALRTDELVRMYERHVTPGQAWDFGGFVFPAMDDHDLADWDMPKADFRQAVFGGVANFTRTHFQEVSFEHAEFRGRTHFVGTEFGGDVNFRTAEFASDVYFHAAVFENAAQFDEAHFDGPVYATRVTYRGTASFLRTRLRNRLLLEGATFAETARLLLWGLDFVHGTSVIKVDKQGSGTLSEPAGQVVFKDIAAGMDRVSFLHTEVYGSRAFVSFINVNWQRDPRRFLYDAQFVVRQTSDWGQLAPAVAINWLRNLFNRDDAASIEDLKPLVLEDVERIVRQIRRSTEAFGSYSDAGDYYVVEMDYRRIRTPWSSRFFTRLALETYGRVSRYGESPVRALGWLTGTIAVFALLYVFTGFRFQGTDVVRAPALRLDAIAGTVADYLRAVLFALANLIPGYFRLQSDKVTSTSELTTVFSFIEALFGTTILTLFVLALRRRFSR